MGRKGYENMEKEVMSKLEGKKQVILWF
jgi:hypothetical protein